MFWLAQCLKNDNIENDDQLVFLTFKCWICSKHVLNFWGESKLMVYKSFIKKKLRGVTSENGKRSRFCHSQPHLSHPTFWSFRKQAFRKEVFITLEQNWYPKNQIIFKIFFLNKIGKPFNLAVTPKTFQTNFTTEALVQNSYVKKVFLKILQNFVFNFFKKETLAQVISCEFRKILRTPLFIEHLLWLLLSLDVYCFQIIEALFKNDFFCYYVLEKS